MKKIFLSIIQFMIATIAISQNTYVLDKNHTSVGFSATHFGISHVEGRFKNVEATLKASKDDFTDAVIEMTASVNSIDTDIEMRDNDLKSEKWFNAAQHPTIVFKSTSFKKIKDKNYKLEGNISIRGIKKPITFDVVYNGKVLNPMSKKNSVGFTITGKLNRNDFGIGADSPTAVVGNEIELRSNAEFIVN